MPPATRRQTAKAAVDPPAAGKKKAPAAGAAGSAPVVVDQTLRAAQRAAVKATTGAGGGAGGGGAASDESIVRALQETVRSLSIAATRPVGRVAQIAAVRAFLDDPNPLPPTLQLFGMPGTGKTAVVRHVLAELKAEAASAGEAHREYTTLFVNGYTLQRPQELYLRLYRHLAEHRLGAGDASASSSSGSHHQHMTPEQAAVALESRFRHGWGRPGGSNNNKQRDTTDNGAASSSSVRPCLLAVDEVDRLCDKSGKVLFRILDWMTLPHAHCRLITIANAMHLPERLEPKTRSRMNTTSRVTFPPYTAEELADIVRHRVAGITLGGPRGGPAGKPVVIFNELALTTMSRQIAGHNGDGRRLLQAAAGAAHELLCRGAASVGPHGVGPPKTGLIEVRHVAPLLRKVLQDRFTEYISGCPAVWPLVVMAAATRETLARESRGITDAVPLDLVRALAEDALRKLLKAAAAANDPIAATAADAASVVVPAGDDVDDMNVARQVQQHHHKRHRSDNLAGLAAAAVTVADGDWEMVIRELVLVRFWEILQPPPLTAADGRDGTASSMEDATSLREAVERRQSVAESGAVAVMLQAAAQIRPSLEMHPRFGLLLTPLMGAASD